jgi:hypothetical protein
MSTALAVLFCCRKGGTLNPPIWTYKEFWSLVITQIIAAATFFGGRYLTEADFEVVIFLTSMFETVGLFLTGVFAHNRLSTEVQAVKAQAQALAMVLDRRAGHQQ